MRRFTIPAVVLLVAAALPALAQTDRTGTIEGRILGPDARPLAEASVLAAQPDGSYPRGAVTGEDGRFRIPFLPPGPYNVSVQLVGYRTASIEGIPVSAGSPYRLEVRLEPSGELVEDVVVFAETPLVDASSTALSVTFEPQQIEYLPYSRNATGLLEFVPGARRDTVWGGSTTQANVYQLDGVNVTDPGFGGEFLLPNPDWIQEFQVKGLGAGAEYGNFQGGLVNIVTKSGGNTFTGAVRMNYESADLASSNVNAFEAGEEQDRRWEVNASVSGPIVKDKLYYFVSAQQVGTDTNVVDVETSTPESVAFLPVQEERSEKKLFGKLTWQATSNDVFDFVYGLDDVETENRGISSFVRPEAATTQESPGNFWNLSWQRVLTPESFLELKITGFEGDDDRLPKNGALPGVRILGGTRDLFRNAEYTRLRTRENRALAALWDSYWDTGSVRHNLKVGGEYNDGSWVESRFRQNGFTWRPEEDSGIPFDANDPATWGFISSDWGGDIDLDADVVNAAVFVQDYLTFSPKWSANFGLRWNSYEGKITPGFDSGPKFDAISDSAIDPRVGVSWDPSGAGDWAVKAHWGRFHQNLFALFFDRVAGANAFRDEEYWDWDPLVGPPLPDVDRNYTEEERPDYFVFFDDNPIGQENGPVENYSQPYVDQWTLSVDRAIGKNWKVGAAYIRRDFEKIVALEDKNLATNYTVLRDISVVDYPSGDPVLDANGNPLVLPELWISNDDILFVGSAPGLTPEEVDALTWNPEFVLTNPEGAKRNMDQVQVTTEYRGSGYTFAGSVVWTNLEGNFYSVSGYDDPAGTGAGPFVRPNEGTNFFGTMPDSSEWEVKLRGTANLPWKLRLGAFLTWVSGDAYTPTFEIDRRIQDYFTSEGDFIDPELLFGVNSQRIYVEPRGSREFESSTLLDLHLDRPFALGKSLDLILSVDVFNVLDDDTPTSLVSDVTDQIGTFNGTGYDVIDPQTQFGTVRLRQQPRTWRLGATLAW